VNSLVLRARDAFRERLERNLTQSCEVVGRGDERLETRFGYEAIERQRQYPCRVVALDNDRRAVEGDQVARRADYEIMLPREARAEAGDRVMVGGSAFEIVATSHDLAYSPCLRLFCAGT
jgi:hypothetical protein